MPRESLAKNACLWLLAGIFLVILWSYKHYGITWDEPISRGLGLADLNYTRHGFFHGDDPAIWSNERWYGGFYEMVSEYIAGFFPNEIYEVRHLVNALTGWVGLSAAGGWRPS